MQTWYPPHAPGRPGTVDNTRANGTGQPAGSEMPALSRTVSRTSLQPGDSRCSSQVQIYRDSKKTVCTITLFDEDRIDEIVLQEQPSNNNNNINKPNNSVNKQAYRLPNICKGTTHNKSNKNIR